MIFLFDKFKKLKGTVRNRHTISLLYERERNGLYTVSAEIPLKITDKKTVYNYHKKVKDSEFLGHYDREGRFQLHKIASVDIEDSSIYIKGVHLFFDEAKAGAIIQERRFRQSELIHGARVAFESIGWSVVDFDVSDEKDYIFYNVSPLEARAILVETFGFEFDYWLDFDGKNIRNKQISAKREMGKDSNKRYNYGHNVLNIKVEQDYSEIYTAVIGRGKGEDLGDDAYGRRIEYTDVEWKTPTNPMNKPKGSRVLHDENATQLFGYHEDGKVSPRTKVEIFEDIEDPAELLQETYNWLRENSVPKAVFSLEVPDGDGLDLGDKVHVIYRDIDLVKHTRVTRVVDDLVGGNRDVEFGDTAYFKTDRRLSGVKSEIKRVSGSMSSKISRLKDEFDQRFEDEIQQLNEDFEQALIDAGASVDAVRAEITEEFEAAQKEFEEEFNQSVADAKQHADDAAEAKAAQVQANLDSFSDEHSKLLSEVQSDVSDARTELGQSISNTRIELENKIDATENALNKVEEDLGDAKTDLQKQLDDARAELDGLEVGGRNLLPAFTSNRWTHQARTEIEDYSLYIPSGFAGNSILFMDVEKNTNYTMSFNSDYARYYIYEVLEDESLGKIIRTTTGSETYTFNTEDISRIRVSINTFSGNVQEEKNIWNIKLEKGTVATDWTPAPEDTEQKITNINQTITNIEGELSTKVEQTEVDALKGTVTRQGTLLSQTADEVSSKAEKSVVDTLTGRVSNAESSVTQNAEEIAKKLTKSVYDEDKKATDAKITQWSNTATETAEGLTRVIGRVSETETGIETAQTRIEAEAGRIDGLLSRTSNVEGKVQDAELAIEANADGLALRATKTEVENAIDGIEVGGRNLLLDSDKYNSFNGSGSPTYEMLDEYKGKRNVLKVTNPGGYINFNPAERYSMPYEVGQKYNVSFSAMYEGLEPTNEPTIYMSGASGGYREFNNSMNNVSFTRINRTFTPSATSTNRIHMNFSGYEVVYIVMDFMIVRGSLPMDWSPAPEDTDASISGVTDRVTTAEAEIKVHAGEISQKASQSELDRVAGRVSTAETSIKQNSDSLKLTATKAEVGSAIDGIEVGGRNLILDSRDIRIISNSSNTYPIETDNSGTNFKFRRILGSDNATLSTYTTVFFTAQESGVYTQSVKVKPDSDIILQMTQSGKEFSCKAGEWTVLSDSFNLSAGSEKRVMGIYTFNNDFTKNNPWIESKEWKVEKGNKATAWTPAPEDTDAKINDISKDYVKQSSVKVTPDRVTIGSTIVNGSTIGSVLSVSPSGIDAVAKAMRLSGDLYVDGDITTLAVNAIEGNFSRLFASSLTTNVIKSNHIQTDTALAKKLFATNANIDELVTRTHFSNSIKTMSIEAAKANFASATASWFGANVIESSWLNVDTALFNRFTSSTAFINSLTAKNAFISDIKAIDIDLNRATATGGSGRNTITLNNNELISHGLFTRTWAGETDTAELNLGIRYGRIMVSNENTGYNLYLTEKGLSTTMAGATAGLSAGTLEFHSQRFNETSRGVTLHSTFGTAALVSDESTIVTRSRLTNNIESDEYSVYIRPTRLSRNGLNEFAFYVKANESTQETDGTLLFGDLTGNNTSGSGLRFSKRRNLNTVYVTNINGDIGTGDISVRDAEIRGSIRTIGGLDVRTWDGTGYNQLRAGSLNTYNSVVLSSHSGGHSYFGVASNEMRVTDNNGYNGGNTTYRDVRMSTLHTHGGFQNHSGAGYVYFGVGGSTGMRITNNNLYNGGNIGWRDIEFRNWKSNSHENYKKDIKEWHTNVLDIFKNELQLYQYKYRDNLENNMIHRGIVLREDSINDKFPAEWRQDDGYNGNEVMWWNTKAIQELAFENENLKAEVAELKTQINKIMEMIK